MPRHSRPALAVLLAAAVAACASGPVMPSPQGFGPRPTLPKPHKQLIPILKIAPAKGWAAGEGPTPAAGLAVSAFAQGLTHPRWLHVLPNGDVLVAETNGPAKKPKGLRDMIMRAVMTTAGAGVPSPNRITLLRDANADGVAETRTVFITGLNSPFGMALVGSDLYVANTDGILRFPYRTGDTSITVAGTPLAALPGGPINHHWTKNLIASPDGTKLFATVGSNSNVGENGMNNEAGRAAIWEIDRASGRTRLFATGLRNPNGMAWHPQSGVLWTVVNERDELGNDLVPDYLTSVRDGGFYGWPYSYYGANVDERVSPQRPDLVARALVPDYATGAHTATLGLAFYSADALPAYRGGAFLGQHGSWNRAQLSGYKVTFIPFAGGMPSGPAQDVLTGFVDKDGKARGRPVGVAIDGTGGVLVADDVGDTIWRIRAASQTIPPKI